MTETEIAYQLIEIINIMWSMQQWWASVSIAVLVVAHVAGARFPVPIALLIIALYTAYSAYMFYLLGVNSRVLMAYAADMQALEVQGTAIAAGSRELARDVDGSTPFAMPVLVGTYLAAVGYLLYQVRRGRLERAS